MEWKPIAEAPRDGRAVLLCQVGEHGYEQWPEAFYWEAGDWYSKIDGSALKITHTHFAPLPPPPAKEAIRD